MLVGAKVLADVTIILGSHFHRDAQGRGLTGLEGVTRLRLYYWAVSEQVQCPLKMPLIQQSNPSHGSKEQM